jgi:putative intracellular protease/amidase
MHKVLVIVGDGAEVIDTLVPFYRLSEDYQVDIAAPAVRTYHMVE